LRVSAAPGALVALGRYHCAPEPAVARGIACTRRLSGGRAVPFGDGYVGVTLVLPHRSALVGDDPHALAPEQVLNRCVRGLLEACRVAGLAPYYGGRDLVTVDGRVVAVVSFEVDEGGALLFEAVVASGADFSVLPARLDAVDPSGIVPTILWTPDDVTSFAQVLGAAPGPAELARLLVEGYRRLGVDVTDASPPPVVPEPSDTSWVASRRRRPELDRRAMRRGQIGVVECHCAVRDGVVKEAILAGDFIANSAAVARLEAALRGAPAARATAEGAVAEAFAPPANFILGLGPTSAVVDVVAEALGA
jgi:lipoate-protein ligase A